MICCPHPEVDGSQCMNCFEKLITDPDSSFVGYPIGYCECISECDCSNQTTPHLIGE